MTVFVSYFFIYDDDDDEIRETSAIFSSSESLFNIFPAKDKQQVDHKEPLQDIIHGHFKALILQLLVSCREELKKMKRVVQYAVFDAYNLSLETLLLNDEGASLPTSISIPEKTFADNAILVITHFSVPLICTVTPASSNMEETHNTLKFASRAKRVKIYLSRNKKLNSSVPIDSKNQRDASSKTSDFNHERSSSKLNDDISQAGSVIIYST
ncbi:hypothetical protein BC332_28309 [Capsicum chinense]|nr:hypothetical protein BC332_28309 [Capsicum chinense]